MTSAHDEISVSDSASAGVKRAAAAHDVLGTRDYAGRPSAARIAHDTLGTSDRVGRTVLLTLGPGVVRTSASLEVKVIRATGRESTGTAQVLQGRPAGSEAAEPPRKLGATPRVEIGITRASWLIGISSAMGGVSQIFAPNNRLAGIMGLAVGYAWAHWRWNQ